jgi:hypothetical protein
MTDKGETEVACKWNNTAEIHATLLGTAQVLKTILSAFDLLGL